MEQLDLFNIEELFSRDKIRDMTNDSWVDFLYPILNSQNMKNILITLNECENSNIKYYPIKKNIFRAFKLTDLYKLKGIILGQDPYHSKDQATGLAFAVPNSMKVPPSLRVIKSKLSTDIDNNLESLAKQGILLLNTALTVKEGSPMSHSKIWQPITDEIISKLGKLNVRFTWMLWGMEAQKYSKLINQDKDTVLSTYHPAYEARGFGKFEPQFEKLNIEIEWEKKTKWLEIG